MSSQPLVSDATAIDAPVDTDAPTLRAPHPHDWKWWARRVVGAVLLGFAVALAYGRRHELRQAIDLLGHLRISGLIAAIALETASLVAFARLQRWLLHEGGVDVGLVPMVQITLAGNALAMSLPGGAAWAAAWAFGQLRRRGADRVLAGWVVLVAGALASYVLFMLLVIGALIKLGQQHSWGWFAFVLLLYLLTLGILGIVAMAVYAIAGPDDTAPAVMRPTTT